MMRAIGFVCLSVWMSCSVAAQSFEVASIRQHVQGQAGRVGILLSGTRVTVLANSVSNLVGYAYDLKSYQVVSGGPDWANNLRWDIEARAPGETALTRDQAMKMVQALLADRFHIKLHRESKEMPVYALVVGKSGPKLKENADPAAGYRMFMSSPKRAVETTTTKGTMDQLAGQLSVNVDRPVLNRTGLTGAYDYKLSWLPDNTAAVADDFDAPSIYTALQEQLGLKLDPVKAPIDVMIIDSVEKPSEN